MNKTQDFFHHFMMEQWHFEYKVSLKYLYPLQSYCFQTEKCEFNLYKHSHKKLNFNNIVVDKEYDERLYSNDFGHAIKL